MLHQFQCLREGSLFYYQHGNYFPPHIINRCPVCGSKNIMATGRKFHDVDEHKKIEAEEEVPA